MHLYLSPLLLLFIHHRRAHGLPHDGPAGAILAPRADPTAVWVTVDDEGQPRSTVTPSATVVDGTPSVLNGAPHDITASVYTYTSYGEIVTSTGPPPPATATAKSGAGAFARCFNLTGLMCEPAESAVLSPGKTYYITWDPDSPLLGSGARSTNSSSSGPSGFEVAIRGDFLNATDGSVTDKAFDTAADTTPVGWGFYPWTASPSLLSGRGRSDGVNISLTLRVGRAGSREMTRLSFNRTILVQYPAAAPPRQTPAPNRQAMLIALPTVLGFVAVCVVGAWVCHRRHGHIGLGNVMSRARHRYDRVGGKISTSRAARRARLAKVDHAEIQLSEETSPSSPSGRDQYRDADRDERQGPTGNVFRDEIRRQY